MEIGITDNVILCKMGRIQLGELGPENYGLN